MPLQEHEAYSDVLALTDSNDKKKQVDALVKGPLLLSHVSELEGKIVNGATLVGLKRTPRVELVPHRVCLVDWSVAKSASLSSPGLGVRILESVTCVQFSARFERQDFGVCDLCSGDPRNSNACNRYVHLSYLFPLLLQ